MYPDFGTTTRHQNTHLSAGSNLDINRRSIALALSVFFFFFSQVCKTHHGTEKKGWGLSLMPLASRQTWRDWFGVTAVMSFMCLPSPTRKMQTFLFPFFFFLYSHTASRSLVWERTCLSGRGIWRDAVISTSFYHGKGREGNDVLGVIIQSRHGLMGLVRCAVVVLFQTLCECAIKELMPIS